MHTPVLWTLRSWIRCGYCYTLVSDNVPPFDSHDFKIYYKRRGIRHRPVTELQPVGNAMAERMVKMILEENTTILHIHSRVRHQLKYS